MGAGKAALGAKNPRLRSFFRLREKSGRAGGIRTHGLHVPNVALYQAEPQPAEKKRRLGARRHEVNRDFRFGSIKTQVLHKKTVSSQTVCSVDVAFLNHHHLSPNSLRYAS